MPLGYQRLNERHQRPNDYINFIKPLETPDKAIAEDFLQRIAAQCYPVMKKHRITVMALEEHEPNPDFLGRNFNAGEVIQLILKDKQGNWLNFNFVQLVMMHELAHCKQMNHSKYFQQVRIDYSKQMEDLWRDGYVGEGIWGHGRGLANGAFVNAHSPNTDRLPEHLCGGTYRRRGRKRKREDGAEQPAKPTYAERQQRRIAKKFGIHGGGAAVGEDELLRGALETMNGGKRSYGKPKVANSKRGRELRANAALARFEQAKAGSSKATTPDLVQDLDSETESEWEDDDASVQGQGRGVIIGDGHGRDMVRICGDEDDEGGLADELKEMQLLSRQVHNKPARLPPGATKSTTPLGEDSETESESEYLARKRKVTTKPLEPQHEDSETEDDSEKVQPAKANSKAAETVIEDAKGPLTASQTELLGEIDPSDAESEPGYGCRPPLQHTAPTSHLTPQHSVRGTADAAFRLPPTRLAPTSNPMPQYDEPAVSDDAMFGVVACPICSLENDFNSPTCMACSHVLRTSLVPDHWRCRSEACKGSKFVNAGDSGRCGVCGGQKPKATAVGGDGRAIGFTRPEVLRWD